jgi:hypothetical protein
MFNNDNRMPVFNVKVMNEFIEFMGSFRVKRRRGFIKDKNFRIGRQDARNDETLALTAGKIGNPARPVRGKADFLAL